MNRHTTYDDWHPGELARLPDKIKRVNGARRMKSLRDDLLPILQTVGDVRLGDSLYPHADQIIDLMREALLSDEAVTAGSMGRWKNPEAFRFENYAHRDGWNGDTRKTIIAALDAVTGEGK